MFTICRRPPERIIQLVDALDTPGTSFGELIDILGAEQHLGDRTAGAA